MIDAISIPNFVESALLLCIALIFFLFKTTLKIYSKNDLDMDNLKFWKAEKILFDLKIVRTFLICLSLFEMLPNTCR